MKRFGLGKKLLLLGHVFVFVFVLTLSTKFKLNTNSQIHFDSLLFTTLRSG